MPSSIILLRFANKTLRIIADAIILKVSFWDTLDGFAVSIDEIKDRLAKFIGQSQLPPTPNLSKNIGHAEAIIKESVLEPDTIDWKEGTLYILDPLLLFCKR